jgi:glycosyltransferase involved in cell wall biosynthesis
MVPARVGIKRTILDKVQLRVENCVARKVRLVILETELVRRQLIAEAKINANRTALIETGVNCQFWKPDSTLNHRIREQYKLGNKVIVLFQARIIERKGAEYLLKAAKVLIHERGYKNVAFLLVGPSCEGDEKPDLETPYLKRLRDFVKANNLDEYVRIVTGWLPTEEVRAFHSASDIYVLPTLSDLTPHSINEAMAMGKPIISTFVGGIPTQVEDGKNGFLVPPRDHYALANKLEILIKSQEIRRRMGIVSRMKALERSVEKKGQRIEKLYLEILSEIK